MDDPRVIFELFGRPIQWYGLMFAGGFLAAVVHWAWLGKRTKRPAGLGSDLGLWIMVGGVVGARAAYVMANWKEHFSTNLGDIIRVDQGGLVFYGGFVGGVTACVLVSLFKRNKSTWTLGGRTRKEGTWSLGDFAVTALPLGHAFGRFGCWMHGCCYGRETTSAFGIPTKFYGDNGQLLETLTCYPVQLFEVVGLLVLYVLCTMFYLRNQIPGRVFAAYMMAYAVLRFCNEFFRGDERLATVTGFNAAQTTAILLFIAGGVLFGWFTKTRITRGPASEEVEAVAKK